MANAEVPDPGLEVSVYRKHPVSAQEPIQFLHPDRVTGRYPEDLDLHELLRRAPRPLRLRLPLVPLAHDSGSAAAPLLPPPALLSSPN